jgi:hypothetical protein
MTNGGWPKDDWAQNLAEGLKKQEQEKRFRDEKDLSDRRMLEEHASPMWTEVRKAVWIRVQLLNEAAGMGNNYITFNDGEDNCHFTILLKRNSENVTFEKRTQTIQFSSGSYKLNVIEGNGVVWKNGAGRESVSDDMAKEIVGEFVKRVISASA